MKWNPLDKLKYCCTREPRVRQTRRDESVTITHTANAHTVKPYHVPCTALWTHAVCTLSCMYIYFVHYEHVDVRQRQSQPVPWLASQTYKTFAIGIQRSSNSFAWNVFGRHLCMGMRCTHGAQRQWLYQIPLGVNVCGERLVNFFSVRIMLTV